MKRADKWIWTMLACLMLSAFAREPNIGPTTAICAAIISLSYRIADEDE